MNDIEDTTSDRPELPEGLVRALKELGCTPEEIISVCLSMITQVADETVHSPRDAHGIAERDVRDEAIVDTSSALIQTAHALLGIIDPSNRSLN
ncbi:hypothetical protein [Neoroseomonas soli]|uniref:Uncharacterized protein n=1 Tax=Neoroseomonas soli TaxID=1081025 RepID=A0A9X9WX17_9PROT|nr:hypothetical protein [Neoroseomonas soli]MBR0671696.1 hypothetical protein [Neoroseomonas soli]